MNQIPWGAMYTERMPVADDVRIYVDLEYCYPGMTRESGRPGSSDRRQVIQIAAIRFSNSTGKEIDSYNRLVHPAFETSLPAFFEELTAITQRDVDTLGVSYVEALSDLVDFCGNDPIYTFDKDWFVLKQNASYFNVPFPYMDTPFVRVKQLLPQWDINPDSYSSGTLYKAAGLHMDGHVHNALHDVRSMAAALRYFTLFR